MTSETPAPASVAGTHTRRAVLRYSLLTGAALAAVPTLGTPKAHAASAVFVVPNPSFEAETGTPGYPDGWSRGSSGSGGTGGLDRTRWHAGAKSFRTTAPTTSDRYTVQLYLRPTTAAHAHRFSVWHQTGDVTGAAPTLQLHFYDAYNNVLASTAVAGSTGTTGWTRITAQLTAPATTRFLSLTLANWYSEGTVWWDDVTVETWPAFTVQGGNYLERTTHDDKLTLTLAAGPATAALGAVEAFGKTLTFVDATTMRAQTGETYAWSGNGVSWNATAGTAQLAANTRGDLTITGGGLGDGAQPGVAFPTVTVAQQGHPGATDFYVIASGFRDPDHAAERTVAQAALTAATKASDYLETRVLPNGAIGIHHAEWPGDIQPDPHGNGSSAAGNLRLWQVTGEQRFKDRAVRILDFLADVQLPSGGFGFPWAYGIANSHFSYPGHYPDGKTHAKGSPMAILADVAASALLEGYHAFGTSAYLQAVERAVGYLLHDPNGLKFLDAAQQYASIPYCTTAPIDANGGRATEVYNIDGSSLSLFRKVYETTHDDELLRYGDALARNLDRRVQADGSITYAWYPSAKPTGYAYIVHGGLLEWADLRDNAQWRTTARRGISWMTNIDRPSSVLWESYTEPLGGVDNTQDVIRWITTTANSQRPDGSWTGGTATRTDAFNLADLAALLRQMELTP